MNLKSFVLASALALAIGGLESAVRAQSSAGRWVATWSTALVGRPQIRRHCPDRRGRRPSWQ